MQKDQSENLYHDDKLYLWTAPALDWSGDSLAGGQISGSQIRYPSQKTLILLLTDGEPADNDVHDPQYLRFDTKNGGRY